jgi:uncharacterized SAM-binding protein YcdF (DUF218 family)
MKTFLQSLVRLLLLLLFLAVLVLGWLCWQIDRYGRKDDLQHVDAIVILGAQVDSSGRPGSDLTSRTYHGVDLYNGGWSPRVICTGGYSGDPMSAAAVACRFAISLGVSPDDVLLADGGMTTAEDARATAKLMRANGWTSVLLVSHPLHLYRASWSFRRHGLSVHASPTTTETHRIFPPLRVWYLIREAGALIVTALQYYGSMRAS